MNLNESIVENAAIEWSGELGYAVGHGQHLAPGEPTAERDSFGEVAAGRAVGSLIHTQGIGDLYKIYLTAQRDGVDFNLAYIPASFTAPHREAFDTEYMRQLYALGYDLAAKGYPWQKAPPGLTVAESR